MLENQNGDEGIVLTAEEQAARERYLAQGQSTNADDANLHGKSGEEGKTADEKQRPEHIPEKFWDAEKGEVRLEELAKSYAELEKLRSKPKDGDDGKPKDGDDGKSKDEEGKSKDGEEGADPRAEIATEITKHREAMTAKIAAGQALADSDYAPFEKIGFTRDDIDGWIVGQEAIGTLAKMEVHGEVGGEDNYKAMIEWARVSYTADEVAMYDEAIHSPDKTVRLNAARGLAARYAQANGSTGVSVTQGGSKGGDTGYASKAEMVADMSNEKYAKDPAFREQVARKVAAAMRNGVVLR